MAFTTKLDYSNNRQIKQYPETRTVLSGATQFGVPFGDLPTGVDLTTSTTFQTYHNVTSTFSGNTGTTVYSWFDPRMELAASTLSAITPSTSAITQTAGPVYTPATSGTSIDGYPIVLTYTGVTFDITPTSVTNLGGGMYSGSGFTYVLQILTANALDFTGSTIWVDVSGITRTNDLIITDSPSMGYVWTCADSEGRGGWAAVSGLGFWSAGTSGVNSIVVSNSGSVALGDNAIAEGLNSTASGNQSLAEGYYTQALGDSSHAEGNGTTAIGVAAHAEGVNTTALGTQSHAEGGSTTASGSSAHAEGVNTVASGNFSHAEGDRTTANGLGSHAGGNRSVANGAVSFVHGSGSTANGDWTIVLGSNITGNTDHYTYVESLNVGVVGSSAFVNDIRIDGNGNLTTNTSDARLKENILPLTNSLSKIKALQGVTYEWIDKQAGGVSPRIGFIAQDVEKVDPLLVFTNKVDSFKGIHIDSVIPLLVEAVKELASGVTETENVYLSTQTILAEDNNIDLNYSGNSQTAINGGVRVLHALGDNVAAEFITNENGDWVTNNNLLPKGLIVPIFTPVSSTDDSGVEGYLTRDDNYIYVKTKSGWKRSGLESF